MKNKILAIGLCTMVLLVVFAGHTESVSPTAVSLSQPTASDITSDSITLRWSKNTDTDFAKYEIHWKMGTGLEPFYYSATITDQSITTYTVTDLQPSTLYQFMVTIVDNSGNSTDSNMVNVWTDEEPYTPPPQQTTPFTSVSILISIMGMIVLLHKYRRNRLGA